MTPRRDDGAPVVLVLGGWLVFLGAVAAALLT